MNTDPFTIKEHFVTVVSSRVLEYDIDEANFSLPARGKVNLYPASSHKNASDHISVSIRYASSADALLVLKAKRKQLLSQACLLILILAGSVESQS